MSVSAFPDNHSCHYCTGTALVLCRIVNGHIKQLHAVSQRTQNYNNRRTGQRVCSHTK